MREKLKTPFRKLRNFALSKQESKEEVSSGIGEGLLSDVAKCMQNAGDMRIKFEGLLTNGQIISGAAYDFSRSLQDMASYMMETFGEMVDEEIGNIFSLLAKVQFEMSKLLDLFATHVSKTIIKPTETMMTKIQEVEILKDQYDKQWKSYVLLQQMEIEKQKGKAKRLKGNLVNQQVIMAKESIKEQADFLNHLMQSLMQGQSESLVTQAVKYHSAQMHLFSKGLASINAVEPMMRQLAVDKIIDRTLPEEDSGYLDGTEMDREGSRLKNDSETESMASSPRHLLVEHIEPPRYSSESSDEFFPRRAAINSKSAPISPLMHHKRDRTDATPESSLESGHERVFMYALPSPSNGNGRWVENKAGTKVSQQYFDSHPQPAYYSGNVLEAYKLNSKSEASDDAVNRSLLHRQIKDELRQMQQHEYPKNTPSKDLDLFAKGRRNDNLSNLIMEKGRRYTQSGPLNDNPPLYKSGPISKSPICSYAPSSTAILEEHTSPLYKSGPISRSPIYSYATSSTAILEEHTSPLYKSGPISRSPMSSYAACNLSPPPLSMPQISELHKLPLPPPGLITPPKSPSYTPSPIAYSAPLGKIVQAIPSETGQASPLPSPLITRSLSIPGSTPLVSDTKKDI